MTPGDPPSTRADRTLRYTGGLQATTPAGITSGPGTAATVTGQIAILTAVNILARVHPEIVLAISDAPLLIACPAGGTALIEACHLLAHAADPDTRVSMIGHLAPEILSVGIGHDAGPATIYAGAARWTARTGGQPLVVTPEPASVMGVGLAICLATGFIFRTAIGLPAVRDRGVSLWTLAVTDQPTGPGAFRPVAVGSVWLVGAGAVGSCLAWWLHLTGVEGTWAVIDGDIANETNLNRSLGLFAADAGLLGGEPAMKSDAAAALIPGAFSYPHWWHDWNAADPSPPDVLIPVANDYGIRPAAAAYGHPATIHATTSRNWTAELHRHLPGQDGCIACRLPEDAPAFACATAPSQSASQGPGRDAALPFLSAAAGLFVLAGLLHLQHSHWQTHDRNHWRLWFDQTPAAIQGSYWQCSRNCRSTPTRPVRRTIHQATRWHHLDTG